jgi:hypothetical protein
MNITTALYVASLILAIIREPHEPKNQIHKIIDSIFFLVVRIQDFMISQMIAVIFYRLALKKKRTEYNY